MPNATKGLNENLPSARAMYASPIRAACDVGSIALGAGGIMNLQQELHSLNAQVAAVEKAAGAEGQVEGPR